MTVDGVDLLLLNLEERLLEEELVLVPALVAPVRDVPDDGPGC